MRYVLGSRASIGGPLGSGRGGAAAWYLAGGVSAANCVAAYQPIGAASLAASYVNLANPGTYDAAPGVAPTWAAATGWTFNGTSQYLVTGVTSGSGWSLIVRVSGITYDYGFVVGSVSSTAQLWIAPGFSSTYHRIGYGNNSGVSTSPRYTDGVFANVSGLFYANGVSGESNPGTFTGGAPIHIGAINSANYTTGKIQAVAIYNVTLSAPQVAAISAAMAAL